MQYVVFSGDVMAVRKPARWSPDITANQPPLQHERLLLIAQPLALFCLLTRGADSFPLPAS